MVHADFLKFVKSKHSKYSKRLISSREFIYYLIYKLFFKTTSVNQWLSYSKFVF